MGNVLQQLTERFEQRRLQNLEQSLHIWYQSSIAILHMCAQALDKEWLVQDDIGVLLDKADRKLFQFRNDATDARRALSRYDRDLSQRVAAITQSVYELRNNTASYLIRTRGPDPFAGHPKEVQPIGAVNDGVIKEVALKARQLQLTVERELQVLWPELERLISQAKKSI